MDTLPGKIKHEIMKVLPPNWKDAPGLLAANHNLLTETNWPRYRAIEILLVTLILMYCVIAELARVIGRHKLKIVFFGPLNAPCD